MTTYKISYLKEESASVFGGICGAVLGLISSALSFLFAQSSSYLLLMPVASIAGIIAGGVAGLLIAVIFNNISQDIVVKTQ